VTAINFQGLFSNVTTEQTVRRLVTIDPNKFNMTLYQMSDQQSRDKSFQSSLEWFRTYLASLQAKLNSLMEELNNIYDEMLNQLMYKRVDSENSSRVLNQVENAKNPATICRESTIVPYNENVNNFEYDPLFASKILDVNNANPSLGTQDLARLYYTQDPDRNTSLSTFHHEYGASAVAAMSYLWMWDVDRINASYATTLDSYYSTETTYKLKALDSTITAGELVNWKVNPGDDVIVGQDLATLLVAGPGNTPQYVTLKATSAGKVSQLNSKAGSVLTSASNIITIDDGITRLWISSTDSRKSLSIDTPGGTDSKIRINTDLDIRGGGTAESYQVNVTALQPNRGVYTPEAAQPDPSEITYLLKENVESDGVLSSDYMSDCKWTHRYINPYVRELDANGNPIASGDTGYGEMTDWLQWRIDKTENNTNTAPGSDPGSQSFHFTTPNNDNYLFEYVTLYDDASGAGTLNDYKGVDYKFGSGVNNTNPTNAWSEVSADHPLTGYGGLPDNLPQNSTWQVDSSLGTGGQVSGSGDNKSYYFGYISDDGSVKTYNTKMATTVGGYKLEVDWSVFNDDFRGFDADNFIDWDMKIVKPNGAGVTVDAVGVGSTYWHWGWTDSGWRLNNPGNPYEHYEIGEAVAGSDSNLRGVYNVKVGYTDITSDWYWPSYVETDFKVTGVAPVGSGRSDISQTINIDTNEGGWFIFNFPVNPSIWYGEDSLLTQDWNLPAASSSNTADSSGGISGIELYYGGDWRPKGEMTETIDLSYMKAAAALPDHTTNFYDPSSYDPENFNPGYDRVELRFKEDISTETAMAANKDLKTVRYATNEYGTNTNDSRGLVGTDKLPTLFTGIVRGDSDTNSQTSSTSGWREQDWLRVATEAETSNLMGTDNLRLQFAFDAVDDYENKFKGWNVDDIQVVARGKSRGELVSPKMDLSDFKTVNMHFFDKADVDSDGGEDRSVWYSLDNGDTWAILDSYGTKTSSQMGWQKQNIDLSCIAGQPNVKLKWVFETDSKGNTGAGWSIDDIQVYGTKKAATDFYYYREAINSNFVDDGTNKTEYTSGAPSTWNQNAHRSNITFDQAKTNPGGKYAVTDGRVEIANTDVPLFSNAVMGYVDQDTTVYNKEKQANGFGSWDTVSKALVYDSFTGEVKITEFKGFIRNELGQYVRTNENNKQEIYVDDAMAINLGISTDKEPTARQVTTKSTGWVNFDPDSGWLPFVTGTCNNETTVTPDTYEFQTIFGRNTFYLDSVASNTTIKVEPQGVDSYIYINGQAVPIPNGDPTQYGSSLSSQDGTAYSYNLDISQYLKEGFNTIAFQSTENQGRNGMKISGVSGFPDNDDVNTVRSDGTSRWAVKVANNGYKGYLDKASKIPSGETVEIDPATGQALSSVTSELYEMFSSDEGKKSISVSFSNVDKDGIGIYSQIKTIKTAITGEPSIQSIVTADYDTSQVTDSGTMWTRLKYGYIDNQLTDPEDISSMNLKQTDNLGYATDIYGKANLDLIFDDNVAIVNDASIAIEIEYYEDTNRDGQITGSELTTVKKKNYGIADLRDDRGEAFDPTATAPTNQNPYKVGYPALTETSQWVREAVENGNLVDRYTYSGSQLLSESNSASGIDKAYDIYNELLVVGKGRTGGADVDGNQNIFVKKLKSVVDSVEYQEIFRFGLLDNIYVAATVSNNRGDQILGKLILDWDWRRRRVQIKQGAFSAVYKS